MGTDLETDLQQRPDDPVGRAMAWQAMVVCRATAVSPLVNVWGCQSRWALGSESVVGFARREEQWYVLSEGSANFLRSGLSPLAWWFGEAVAAVAEVKTGAAIGEVTDEATGEATGEATERRQQQLPVKLVAPLWVQVA